MSEMMERVARAIDAGAFNPDFEREKPESAAFGQGVARRAAMRAIKAMREPTDGMLKIEMYLTDGGDDPDFKDIWQQMIDEALK